MKSKTVLRPANVFDTYGMRSVCAAYASVGAFLFVLWSVHECAFLFGKGFLLGQITCIFLGTMVTVLCYVPGIPGVEVSEGWGKGARGVGMVGTANRRQNKPSTQTALPVHLSNRLPGPAAR